MWLKKHFRIINLKWKCFQGNTMSKKLTILLMLAPALIVICVVFAGGLALGLSQSLGYMPIIGKCTFSIEAYIQMIMSKGFIRSLLLTLFVSIMTTVLSVVIAIVTALALRQRFRGKKTLTFVYQFPVTIPDLVTAVCILMLVSQSGLFSRVLFNLGFISDQSQFPALTSDDFGVGIILVYVWKQAPFIGLIALAVLQSVGNDFEALGKTLGANSRQVFRHILLPLIIPGILPASIICFAYTFGSFEVPYLLGKTFPAMLSVLSYRWYIDVDLNARPQAMAMSIFIAVFVMILVIFYRKLARKLVRS